MRDITLGITFYQYFTTRAFATGIPGTLGGTPVISAYEDNNDTQITAGVSLSVDFDSVTGLNLITVVATSGNGFENGKSYALVITTGTVDSVSVVGEVVGEFTIGQSAAAVDLANGSDGLTALKTGIDAIPTTAMRGTDNVVLSGPTKAEMDTAHALLATPAQVASELATYDGPTNAEMEARTLEAAAYATAASIAALNDPTAAAIAAAVHQTQMTEGYAADGVAPTLEEFCFMVMQGLLEFAISGTDIVTKKIDKTTTAMSHTLDDAASPTSRTRA